MGSTLTLTCIAKIALQGNIRASLRTVAKPVPQVELLNSIDTLVSNQIYAHLSVRVTVTTWSYHKLCLYCLVGTYSGPRESSCKACVPGQYYTASLKKCVDCKAGYYSKSPLNACKKCPAGLYSNNRSAECKKCAAGTKVNSNQSGCIKA